MSEICKTICGTNKLTYRLYHYRIDNIDFIYFSQKKIVKNLVYKISAVTLRKIFGRSMISLSEIHK